MLFAEEVDKRKRRQANEGPPQPMLDAKKRNEATAPPDHFLFNQFHLCISFFSLCWRC